MVFSTSVHFIHVFSRFAILLLAMEIPQLPSNFVVRNRKEHTYSLKNIKCNTLLAISTGTQRWYRICILCASTTMHWVANFWHSFNIDFCLQHQMVIVVVHVVLMAQSLGLKIFVSWLCYFQILNVELFPNFSYFLSSGSCNVDISMSFLY